MYRHRLFIITGFAALMAAAQTWGQSGPPPRLLYVMPPGGQAGTTIEMLFTGQDIDNADGLYFSLPGVKVERIGSEKTPPVIDPKIKKPPPKMPVGALSQKFKVTLPPNAPLGIQDVRILTKGGVSNPRAFVVGDVKEFVEREPNSDVPEANRVEMNCAVSGVISTPIDVDYFLFTGRKGQRVVVSCLTTSIDSKLPAVLELYSPTGALLATGKGYQGNDALLDAELPTDGDYYVRVNSFTYTLGGPDYWYRLTIGTMPWIDAVMPSVVEPGKETPVTVYGRNLPGGAPEPDMQVGGRVLDKATIRVKAPSGGATHRLDYRGFVPPIAAFVNGFELRLRNDAGSSNAGLVSFATRVFRDNGQNDTQENAQRVSVPCVIAGHIEKKADRDWYTFAARKGQVLSIEAYGDRIGAPVDLLLKLVSSSGTTVTELDDNPDTTAPQFFTRSEDPPRYRFAVTADGDYSVMVTSRYAFTESGPRHAYQLRITPEQPDFHLIAMPPSPFSPDGAVVGQGGHQAFTVFVYRQDGFSGEIVIGADKLPPGVTLSPQTIPAGAKQSAIVLSAAADAANWTGGIRLTGTATINGEKVTREVRAATITWPVQQPVPTITRLDREVVLAVRDKPPFILAATTDKITVKQGDRISVPVKLSRQPNFNSAVNITAIALPVGYGLQPVTLTGGKDTATVNLDAKPNAPPGVYTLILRGQTGPVGKLPMPLPKGAPNVIAQPSTPITLIIAPRQLAKVKLRGDVVKLQPGKQVDVPLDVARLFDYEGPFKIELIVPPNVTGVRAAEAQIKPGESAGKLTLRADADAKAGPMQALTVRVTAMFNGDTPIVHETKLNVTIVK